MRTVRRLYFYLLAAISAEVVVWGAVSLLRTVFSSPAVGTGGLLAGGLAAVLVGLPIFAIHWTAAQRDAGRDPGERISGERALFFYGLRLALLIPIVQSAMALVNRFFLDIVFQADLFNRFLGRNQTIADHLASILINGLALAYFQHQLRQDARAAPSERRQEIRRLWRHAWLVYTLALTVLGAVQLLRFLTAAFSQISLQDSGLVAAGLALLLVGAPLWAFTWTRMQAAAQADPLERHSTLRLAVLFALSLVGLLVSLYASGIILSVLLRVLLGEPAAILRRAAGALAAAVPFGVMGAYYIRALGAQIRSEPLARQPGLARAWRLVLALVGNLAVFGGAEALLSALVEMLVGGAVTLAAVRAQLAAGLAALALGLPFWLSNWQRLQAEAFALTDQGGEARRSTLRRGYLYLIIFLAVVGLMSAGGTLLYRLINAALGAASPGLIPAAAQRAQLIVLLLVWLVYHLRVLRGEGAASERSLAARHAAFGVLILEPPGGGFALPLEQALTGAAPGMPVARHPVEAGAPGDELSSASAVVLPSDLALQAPDSLRLWLANFPGQQVIVPRAQERISFAAAAPASDAEAARTAAELLRALAEGKRYAPRPPAGPWAVAGYILASLFALQLLALLVFALANLVGS